MTLQQPWFLLPALLLLLIYWLWRSQRVTDDWQRVIHPEVLQYFVGPMKQIRQRKIALLVAALGCLALSGPSVQDENNNALRHNETWFVVADVSRSMTLSDITPNRIAAMRDAATNIASEVSANAIALIIYAGDAFLVTPPSFDTASFTSHVALLDYGLVPVDGSNLTRALSLVLSISESSGLINSRIIILSDSGGMNTRAEAAVNRLYKTGHRTDVVLFGSNNSSSSPFDIKAAEKIASTGGGRTIIADKLGNTDIESLALGKLDFSRQLLTQTGLVTVRLTNLSHWLLLLGVPLVLLMFYRERH